MANRKTFAQKIYFLFRQSEFKFVLFFAAMIVLCWPFFVSMDNRPVSFPFRFYFIAWAVFTLLLFISSLGKGDDLEDK